MLTKKRKLLVDETVALTEGCSAILQYKLIPKLKNPRSFTVPCSIRNLYNLNALIYCGASINLIPLSIYWKLGLDDLKANNPTASKQDTQAPLWSGRGYDHQSWK